MNLTGFLHTLFVTQSRFWYITILSGLFDGSFSVDNFKNILFRTKFRSSEVM